MTTRITNIHIRNYRALADVQLDLGPIGVLFGPNGAGKSTLLDSLWFVRDCAIRGVELASASRSHGIGILFDGAAEEEQRVVITLRTDTVEYELRFDLTSGRINPSPGEHLTSRATHDVRIDRKVGSDDADLYNSLMRQSNSYKLRDTARWAHGFPAPLAISAKVNARVGLRPLLSLEDPLNFVNYTGCEGA